MVMEEIWKDIEGYEGLYQVSSLGRVYSLLSKKILKQQNNNRGYPLVSLSKNGVNKRKSVHRLEWEAFNGSIPDGMQVNHINEIKTDNRLENLNLMTPKENANWGTKNSRVSRHHKKPVTQYAIDGTPLFTYFSSVDASADTGINQSNIIQCCRHNKNYKTAGGYIWRYAF